MNYLILVSVFLFSFALLFLVMPKYIDKLVSMSYHQQVSEYALKEYQEKKKTPIMGGLLFVVIPLIVVSIIYPSIYTNPKTLMVIVSYVLFCSVGFIDDYLIIVRKDNKGLSPKKKLAMQIIFAILISILFFPYFDTSINIPFTTININLSFLYYPFLVLLFCAESNAVNFTDGMDGLCAGVSSIALLPFILFAFLLKEYAIVYLLVAILGGILAYLHYNKYPARIFMGDSGSIALGGLFASLAVVLGKEVALLFVGGVFVWEMFCVVVQLSSVKLFHKRVFSYTPIHYAFQLKGMKETKIVSSFYIIEWVCAFVGLIIGVFG